MQVTFRSYEERNEIKNYTKMQYLFIYKFAPSVVKIQFNMYS
jgi:hypothetical protein